MTRETRQVKLEKLVRDETFYPRNDISAACIRSMIDAMEAGVKLPPILVDAKSMRIVDGFHRFEAFKKLKREMIPAILKEYPSDGEIFADAVRLNVAHGRKLDTYDLRRSAGRLEEFGFDKTSICEIMRIPPLRLEELKKGFATTKTHGEHENVPLKWGLMHHAGARITRDQADAIEKYSGMEGTFHARQLILLLESDLWKRTPAFIAAMDKLIKVWVEAKEAVALER